MQTFSRTIAALCAVGAISSCASPPVSLQTGGRAATTPGAAANGFGMLALPPVVVRPMVARHPTGGDGVERADTVLVTLSEWKVELSRDHVTSGTVVFHVRNNGTMPHAFEIEGEGLERAIQPFRPGTDRVVSIALREGKYEAYCPIGEGTAYAHKTMGMRATLISEKAASATNRPAASASN